MNNARQFIRKKGTTVGDKISKAVRGEYCVALIHTNDGLQRFRIFRVVRTQRVHGIDTPGHTDGLVTHVQKPSMWEHHSGIGGNKVKDWHIIKCYTIGPYSRCEALADLEDERWANINAACDAIRKTAQAKEVS